MVIRRGHGVLVANSMSVSERATAAVFVGILIMLASWSGPARGQCAVSETPAVVYQPPTGWLLREAKAAEIEYRYRPYAKVEINIGNDGIPTSVSFLASTGSRTADKAIQAWAMHFRFAQDTCDVPTYRTIAMPVDLTKLRQDNTAQ